MSIEIYLPKKHENNPNQNPNDKENNNKNNLLDANDKFSGLQNHGNTCYLNSFLQSMFMTPKFRSNVLKFNYEYNKYGPKNDCIPYQLQKLFARLQLKLRPSEETTQLTTSFGWTSAQVSEQNDIQELCHVLFDAISYTNEKYINDLFQSILSTNIKCKECGNISSHDEIYIDISLPIKKGNKTIDTLEKSFEYFFSIEELIKDNQYMCEKCQKKVDAEKYFEIKQLPKILICALNRFEYDYKKGIKKKINTPLSIPDKITHIGNIDNIEYNLYGIIVHSGGAMGGHYYSLIQNFEDKDKKWFKFDDRTVFEINNIEEFKKFISGNENNFNDSTAYILLYEDAKEQENNAELKFDINESLLEDINIEEEEYKRYLEEEKERMSYLNLKVFYNDKLDYIKIKKTEKLLTFKNKIFDLYGINKNNENNPINIENDSRIIIYNNNNNKIINILNPIDNDTKSLEELNLTQNHIYHLDIKKSNETFDIFNPDDINISLIKWDDNFLLYAKDKKNKKNQLNIENNGIRIKINKNISIEDFIKTIKNNLNYGENDNILIHKKQEYGYNNIDLITFNHGNHKDLKRFLSDDNLIFYIEPYNEQIEDCKFKLFFNSLLPDIKVIFNTPIPEEKLKKIKRINVKDYKFDKSIEICPKYKMSKLKEEIGKILNISIDTFIFKKNSHNGVEIKKLEDTIDKYSTKNLTIYIQFGIPRKEGDILLNFQQYYYDISEFHLYPYKSIDLGFMIFDKKTTLNEVINVLQTKNKKFVRNEEKTDNNNENGNDKNNNIKYYLREEKNFKPGKLYLDGSKTLIDIGVKEGDILICQGINPENIFIDEKNDNNDRLNFSVRFFEHKNWKISEIFEIFVNKKINTKDFYLKVLKNIINEKKIECNDINELEGVKISNNELFYFMDEILISMAFISFTEFEESSIYNYPFLLNSNGAFILVRYNCNDLREPTIEEMNYFYKPKKSEGNVAVKPKKKLGPSTNKVKTNFKKEVYKEKAMKINVKKFEENKDSDK